MFLCCPSQEQKTHAIAFGIGLPGLDLLLMLYAKELVGW